MNQLSPEFVEVFTRNFAELQSLSPSVTDTLLSTIERMGERDSVVDWWSDTAERNLGPMSPTNTTHSAELANPSDAAAYATAFWRPGDDIAVDVLFDGAITTVSAAGRVKSRCVVLKTPWGKYPAYYPYLC